MGMYIAWLMAEFQDILYCALAAGNRTTGHPYCCYKDVYKYNLKVLVMLPSSILL